MNDQEHLHEEPTPESEQTDDKDQGRSGMVFASPGDADHHDNLNFEIDVDNDGVVESYALGQVILPNAGRLGASIERDVDVDAALQSVSALSDVIAQQEAEEAAERARAEAEIREAEEARQRRASYYMPRPPLLSIQRGQLTSVVPALLLIAVGAWLTFAFATAPPDPLTIGMVLVGSVGVLLLNQWLVSGRWAQGALFNGLALLLTVGTLYLLTRTDGPGSAGWPLLITSVGAAALLSGLLSRQPGRLQMAAGIVIIAAGAAGYAVTSGALTTPEAIITNAGPIFLVVVVVLILLPMLFTRRRG
jgi:hypothetical protein